MSVEFEEGRYVRALAESESEPQQSEDSSAPSEERSIAIPPSRTREFAPTRDSPARSASPREHVPKKHYNRTVVPPAVRRRIRVRESESPVNHQAAASGWKFIKPEESFSAFNGKGGRAKTKYRVDKKRKYKAESSSSSSDESSSSSEEESSSSSSSSSSEGDHVGRKRRRHKKGHKRSYASKHESKHRIKKSCKRAASSSSDEPKRKKHRKSKGRENSAKVNSVKIREYPEKTPRHQMHYNWRQWLRHFEAAMIIRGKTSTATKAALLYTTVGNEVSIIIDQNRMNSAKRSGRKEKRLDDYELLKRRLEKYFKSLTDKGTNLRILSSLRQEEAEGVGSFHARVLTQAEVCCLSHKDSAVRLAFLNGLANASIAEQAHQHNHPMSYVLQVVNRTEIQSDQKREAMAGSAVNAVMPLRRDRLEHPGLGQSGRSQFAEQDLRRDAERSGIRQATSRLNNPLQSIPSSSRAPFKPGSCPLCGLNKCGGPKSRNGCMAKDMACNSCGTKGHTSRRCNGRGGSANTVEERKPAPVKEGEVKLAPMPDAWSN